MEDDAYDAPAVTYVLKVDLCSLNVKKKSVYLQFIHLDLPGTGNTVRNKTITSLERYSDEVMRPFLGQTLRAMSASQRSLGFFKSEGYIVGSLGWESIRKQ